MDNKLRFDGRVAIVTGAGNGLGRSHALLLASRGAKVVVNDLGGSFNGEGKSANAADKVVDEIRAAGGTAVASYDSVTDGDKIVAQAMGAFGRIDIVINNAGILRDVSFAKMSPQDWDLVYQVHVLGAFRLTHAAWPHMRDAGYGRVVMTASAAGIYGNFGQANYSMVKLGLHGFAQTLALEGKKRNVLVNTIAPIAGSRLTETVLPANLVEALRPEFVSPLVARLVHESSQDSGGLYEVGGGFYAKLRWERSSGKTFRIGRPITIEDVNTSWGQITQFESTTHPDSVNASMQPIMENLDAGPSKGGNEYIDVDQALDYRFEDQGTAYDERDVAIYAFGVGGAQDPDDQRDLQLVYEQHDKGMKVLPTFGAIPAVNAVMGLGRQGKSAPGLQYGLDRVLHGEQYTELARPLPANAKLTHKIRIKDIFDKGKHALVVTEVASHDADGNLLVRNEMTTVIRGAGGWGGERGPTADANAPPDRKPDAVVEERIPASQALRYRLSGDWNPLHVDGSFAKAMGFERPILHGLCTFGYAARHVLMKFAPEGNSDFFKSIRARFADNVFPGETLITDMWRDGQRRVIFRCTTKERGRVVISNAAVEFFDEVPAKAAKTTSASAPPDTAPIGADVIQALASYVAANPDLASKAKTVFQFRLSDPETVCTLDLKNGGGAVGQGETAKPDVTLALADADFVALYTGKADAMKLFTTGKIKISGDMGAAQRLQVLRGMTPDLVTREAEKRLRAAGGGGERSARPGAAPPAEALPIAADVFRAIAAHVTAHPEVVGKAKTSFQFRLSDPVSVWTVDLRNDAGRIAEGEVGKPDVTLALTEADFIGLYTGSANAMKLFTTGKLKITGDIAASQRLQVLAGMTPDLVARETQRRVQGAVVSTARGGAAAPAAEPKPAKATEIFTRLAKRLVENPTLSDESRATYQFMVTEPDDAWLVDLVSSPPTVTKSKRSQAGTVLTLSDDALDELTRAGGDARGLFQQGRMRVDGDVRAAHRLGFMKGLLG